MKICFNDSDRHISELMMILFMAGLIFLVYSNSLNSPFVFDDINNIRDNRHIRMAQLTLDGIVEAGFKSRSKNRPAANISFALNYYLNRYNVSGYRIFNIFVHIFSSVFLYLFLKTTLCIMNQSKHRSHDDPLTHPHAPASLTAFSVAVIWGVHPLHTQSVTYIIQRMNSMAAMFYLLSLFLYAKGRFAQAQAATHAGDETAPKRFSGLPASRFYYAGSICAGILALGSKETALTLPFVVFLYEWYMFQDLNRTWLKRGIIRLAAVYLIIAGAVFMCLNMGHWQKNFVLLDDKYDFTVLQRVMTEFRVIMHYLSLMFFPHPGRLTLLYDFSLSYSPLNPITTLFSMASVFSLLILSVCIAKKERLISFCILWFLANNIIESSIVLLALVFEHRTYLPSAVVFVIPVLLVNRFAGKKWLTVISLVTVVAILSAWTYERNSVWSDKIVFWKDGVKKSPDLASTHSELGVALFEKGFIDEAITHYEKALKINSDSMGAHFNIGIAYESKGDFDQAVRHYLDVLKINPSHIKANTNLGNVYTKQGRTEDAVAVFSNLLKIDPGNYIAHDNIGVIYLKTDRLADAIHHFNMALRIKPDDRQARKHLEWALMKKKQLNFDKTY